MKADIYIIVITLMLVSAISALLSALALEQEWAKIFNYLFFGFSSFLCIYVINDEYEQNET